ncbi:MAG TPA: GNAT family N-acetyltransferase [Amycolatopsis sp.]|uniref:GNAT family N-acetyltransferase n=1 Tax=Amycolatopsis sp. TaxID=37632 RepID=UPI002B45D397|nr:GNAT family N-acetyltransferase [Amycolatopsis sp.]HKS47678.1 GNAT family N-acetyltransferase [Amycolatopsis sp.]
MEPVEINAGEYYLRQLRADDRLDDRPALVEAFADAEHQRFVLNYRLHDLDEAGRYVALRACEWASGRRCSWAIAEPTTGRLLGEVGLKDLDPHNGTAEVALWVHPSARRRGVGVTALNAALRFGSGALGLREVNYLYHEGNVASAAVARRCGFQFLDTLVSSDGRKLLRCIRVTE